MNKIIFIYILIFFCIGIVSARQLTDYSVHANIIYRITKYVNWPESKKTGDFIVGIVGESPLYNELLILSKNKRVGSQQIVIKRFAAGAQSYNAHILFITEEESGSVKRIANTTEGKPVLILSENNNLIGKGSCINFILVGDHLKLEFGTRNIEKRDLQIASELLALGTIVN